MNAYKRIVLLQEELKQQHKRFARLLEKLKALEATIKSPSPKPIVEDKLRERLQQYTEDPTLTGHPGFTERAQPKKAWRPGDPVPHGPGDTDSTIENWHREQDVLRQAEDQASVGHPDFPRLSELPSHGGPPYEPPPMGRPDRPPTMMVRHPVGPVHGTTP